MGPRSPRSRVKPAPDEASEPGGFLQGLSAGWDALFAFLRGTVLVLGALLPWLALGGLIALVVVGARRVINNRRPHRGVDANGRATLVFGDTHATPLPDPPAPDRPGETERHDEPDDPPEPPRT